MSWFFNFYPFAFCLQINICAPLTNSSCTKDKADSAVCEVQPHRSVGMAPYNSKLQLTDGHLRLSYRGTKFSSGKLYNIIQELFSIYIKFWQETPFLSINDSGDSSAMKFYLNINLKRVGGFK